MAIGMWSVASCQRLSTRPHSREAPLNRGVDPQSELSLELVLVNESRLDKRSAELRKLGDLAQ